MADPSFIRPTAFPRLDDLSLPILCEDHNETQYKRHDFSFATNYIPCPRGRDALLEDYSQFIAAYTVECEVTFQYALRTQLYDEVEPKTIQARTIDTETLSDHGDIKDYTFNIMHPEEGRFDFGLEVVAVVDNFISTEIPPLLDCVSILRFASISRSAVYLT